MPCENLSWELTIRSFYSVILVAVRPLLLHPSECEASSGPFLRTACPTPSQANGKPASSVTASGAPTLPSPVEMVKLVQKQPVKSPETVLRPTASEEASAQRVDQDSSGSSLPSPFPDPNGGLFLGGAGRSCPHLPAAEAKSWESVGVRGGGFLSAQLPLLWLQHGEGCEGK